MDVGIDKFRKVSSVEKTSKSAKRCCICRGDINIGDKYFRSTWVCDSYSYKSDGWLNVPCCKQCISDKVLEYTGEYFNRDSYDIPLCDMAEYVIWALSAIRNFIVYGIRYEEYLSANRFIARTRIKISNLVVNDIDAYFYY